MEKKYWPFPILKPESEWSMFDRDYIALMEIAFAEGYQPYEGFCSSVELGVWGKGRSASLVWRGNRNGWEPWLADDEKSHRLGPYYNLPLGESACVCVRPPFCAAAHLVLQWMRGHPLDTILFDYEFVGGSPPGIKVMVSSSV